ncbi:MAG: 50S ribosomal protein L22 [Candidatus Woesearchaeota archaeon]
MGTYRYSTNTEKEGLVKTVGIGLGISRKKGIEICNFIRGKSLERAKKIMDNVMEQKEAIPYRRFNKDTGHKPGIGPGRYPIKTCKEIKVLLERLEASANQKGLETKSLIISHISAQQGGKQWHYGRQRRRMQKRAHIEIVAQEARKQEAPKQKKPEKKAIEAKPEHKKTKANK